MRNGFCIAESRILTDEMRDYHSKNGNLGAVPIVRSIDEAGFGAVELALRWSSIGLGDGLIDGSDMDTISLAGDLRERGESPPLGEDSQGYRLNSSWPGLRIRDIQVFDSLGSGDNRPSDGIDKFLGALDLFHIA